MATQDFHPPGEIGNPYSPESPQGQLEIPPLPGSATAAAMSKTGDQKDPRWLDNFVRTTEGGEKQVQPLGVAVGIGLLIWLLA